VHSSEALTRYWWYGSDIWYGCCRLFGRPRDGRDPRLPWIPAFAGMTRRGPGGIIRFDFIHYGIEDGCPDESGVGCADSGFNLCTRVAVSI